MKKVQIFVVHSKKCKDCDNAIEVIESAIQKCEDIECELLKFLFDTKVGLNIAINNDIDDIPGIVVGRSEVFKGNNYSEKKIINAIKKASKDE